MPLLPGFCPTSHRYVGPITMSAAARTFLPETAGSVLLRFAPVGFLCMKGIFDD